MGFDRYSKFRSDGNVSKMPFIAIPEMDSDYYRRYHKGKDRLDLISYDYYGDCDYAWLIMEANPEYGACEYDIPDDSKLRIPYPLEVALENYNSAIEEYRKTYSI